MNCTPQPCVSARRRFCPLLWICDSGYSKGYGFDPDRSSTTRTPTSPRRSACTAQRGSSTTCPISGSPSPTNPSLGTGLDCKLRSRLVYVMMACPGPGVYSEWWNYMYILCNDKTELIYGALFWKANIQNVYKIASVQIFTHTSNSDIISIALGVCLFMPSIYLFGTC